MTDKKTNNDTSSGKPIFKKSYKILFIILTVLVILSPIFLYAYKFGIGLWNTPEQWGSLGDFFGGVLNPLLGFLSLIFLLITLTQNQKALSQNKEALNQNEKALKINSDELILTREEVSGSRHALEEQAKILEKQNFEGTFFQLLSLYNEIVSSIDFENETGRDSFKKINNHLHRYLTMDKSKDIESKINDGYLKFYAKFHSELGHYFRVIYNIVKFVDNSDLDNKRVYTNLIRAQLSTDELRLILYNCLSDEGKKFKPLVEKYSLLKFLPINSNLLIFKGKETELYNITAFKKI